MTKEQDEIRLKDLLGIFSNEDYKDLIGILKRDQERYHKEQVKKINTPNVSQQLELLSDFAKHRFENNNINVTPIDDEDIELFLGTL